MEDALIKEAVAAKKLAEELELKEETMIIEEFIAPHRLLTIV